MKLLVQVYYNTPIWRKVEEVHIYSHVKFLCDIGSILGLMLGASVLSLCECSEWVIVKLLDFRRRTIYSHRQ